MCSCLPLFPLSLGFAKIGNFLFSVNTIALTFNCDLLTYFSYILYLMSYVLCLMSYVLCLMPYFLCLMSYVLCLMSYVLCLMSYVLCPLSYVLCLMSYVILGHPEERPLQQVWRKKTLSVCLSVCGRQSLNEHVCSWNRVVIWPDQVRHHGRPA